MSLFDAGLSHHFAIAEESNSDSTDYSIITPYDAVPRDLVQKTVNLDYQGIVDSYSKIDQYSTTVTYANHFVLALINAADETDESSSRRENLLIAAEDLNTWILRKDSDPEVHVLNSLQITLRNRKLTPDELTRVRSIRREAMRDGGNFSDQIALTCGVILGEREEALYLWSGMSPEAKAEFQNWPIYNLLGPMLT